MGGADAPFFGRLRRLAGRVGGAVRRYVWDVRVRDESTGWFALKAPLRAGPLFWPGMVLLLLGVVAVPALVAKGQDLPALEAELWEGEVVRAPAPSLGLSLLLVSLGWSYVLVGASGWGVAAYVPAALYAAFYGLTPALNLAGSYGFLLIPLWLLLLGAWVASAGDSRWCYLWLVVLSGGVALLAYPSSGLKAIVPGTPGRLLLCALLFWLSCVLASRRWRYDTVWAAALTCICFAATYSLAWRVGPLPLVFQSTFLTLHYFLGLLSLFWIWMGLDLYRGAESVAAWASATVTDVVPSRLVKPLLLVVGAAWTAVAVLVVGGPPSGVTGWLWDRPLGRPILAGYAAWDVSPELEFALQYHLYVIAFLVAAAAGLALSRRLSNERLIGLFGIGAFAFLVLYGLFGVWFALASEEWRQAIGFLPLLAFVMGMFWQIMKAVSGFMSDAVRQVALLLGLLLIFCAISVLELAAGYSYFLKEMSLNPFLGICYLGPAYLLLQLVQRESRLATVSPRLAAWFVWGMGSALLALLAGQIWAAPLLRFAALALSEGRTARRFSVAEATLSSGVMAVGFVMFYTHPLVIPIPAYLAALAQLGDRLSEASGYVVWPWEGLWWGPMLGVLTAAIILGGFFGMRHWGSSRRRLLLMALGPLLSGAWLLLCELVLLG